MRAEGTLVLRNNSPAFVSMVSVSVSENLEDGFALSCNTYLVIRAVRSLIFSRDFPESAPNSSFKDNSLNCKIYREDFIYTA